MSPYAHQPISFWDGSVRDVDRVCLCVRVFLFFSLGFFFCALFRVQCWSYSGYQWLLERIAAAAVFLCVKRRQRGFFSPCPACWRRELFHRAALGMHQVRRAPFRFLLFLSSRLSPFPFIRAYEGEGGKRAAMFDPVQPLRSVLAVWSVFALFLSLASLTQPFILPCACGLRGPHGVPVVALSSTGLLL